MKKSRLNTSTNRPAASSRVIEVKPSVEQLERLELVAKLLQTTPDRLLLAYTLSNLDDEMEEPGPWLNYYHAAIDTYADGRAWDLSENQTPIELQLPDRMLRLAGYKFEEAAK